MAKKEEKEQRVLFDESYKNINNDRKLIQGFIDKFKGEMTDLNSMGLLGPTMAKFLENLVHVDKHIFEIEKSREENVFTEEEGEMTQERLMAEIQAEKTEEE